MRAVDVNLEKFSLSELLDLEKSVRGRISVMRTSGRDDALRTLDALAKEHGFSGLKDLIPEAVVPRRPYKRRK
ncbi:hypothetical protein [Defluviimonas salinarum]|uniref:Uncharacterized protein n=1 Tax=Defluviimonas salinarum TaxID=2992147 RepID=A0ABT3J929_9RHOB|nr:hypothetical protein [Defluviimonas salinarum]MCW3783894.1 hypothetical protein [Defluviimonas salinarum]